MFSCTDQLNRKIELGQRPKRIISIVPSQTELLYDLGADEKVIGITKFCIHPDQWFSSKTHVGGTKKLNFEKIKSLQPDLIIGNKEENEKSQVEELMKHYPVWMSDIKNPEEAINMIRSIGDIVDRKEKSQRLTHKIQKEFKKLTFFETQEKIPTAYIIWNDPVMCAGRNTFIDAMLMLCGFKNIFNHTQSRYPKITTGDLTRENPSLILLSSEPFPFKEKHIKKFREACPHAIIKLVDGELFSWYGSRMQYAPDYFLELINSLNLS